MIDPTATHLTVWQALFDQYPINTVLEFGCGLYSTTEFLKRGCDLTSIEMQSEDWFSSIKREHPKLDLRLSLGPMEWMKEPLKDRYDLIFVDGHGDSRPECMMWARDRANIIVAHDTEHPYYGWERANMDGFIKTVHSGEGPWTTVWVKA